jgi:hypothetical protein
MRTHAMHAVREHEMYIRLTAGQAASSLPSAQRCQSRRAATGRRKGAYPHVKEDGGQWPPYGKQERALVQM